MLEEQENMEQGAQQRTWRNTAGSNLGNVTAAQRRAASAALAANADDAPDPSKEIRKLTPEEQLQLVQEATIAYVKCLTRIIKVGPTVA